MKLENYSVKSHEFKHSIEIQRCTPGVDEDNIPIPGEYTTYFNTRAKVLTPSAKEYLEAQKIGIEVNKTFIIRARSNKTVSSDDIVIYKGEKYEIVAPPNNIQDGGLYIEIKAKLIK